MVIVGYYAHGNKHYVAFKDEADTKGRFMITDGFLLAGGQMVYGEAAPEEIRKPWPVPVVFRNGYSKDSPEIVCKCTLQFGEGKPEWGAEPGKMYYVLKIQETGGKQDGSRNDI